ncbi:MAG TPA: polyprenyl synthetase family protein, partial [Bacteroidia bacterium]|nr:polyprenyl synthetase family protein [Bacteroidia bacterium]
FLGASLAGYSKDFTMAADRFGRHLGIAYQIYDDLVDFLGEERKIGKTLGTDFASGKLTLPLMLLLEKMEPNERAAMVEGLRAGGAPDLALVSKQKMNELGIAQSIVDAIDQELVHAISVLEPHLALAPVSLMQQLAGMLKSQVASLSTVHGSR